MNNDSKTLSLNSKSENRNPKQIRSTKMRNPKQYDLEDRTLEFAKRVRALVKKLPRTIGNIEDGKQVVRSSGSVAMSLN